MYPPFCASFTALQEINCFKTKIKKWNLTQIHRSMLLVFTPETIRPITWLIYAHCSGIPSFLPSTCLIFLQQFTLLLLTPFCLFNCLFDRLLWNLQNDAFGQKQFNGCWLWWFLKCSQTNILKVLKYDLPPPTHTHIHTHTHTHTHTPVADPGFW